MDLTETNVKIQVQKAYDMFFQFNSLLDNVANFLDISSNLPKFGTFIHHNISHPQPIIADIITDFGRERGTRIVRNALVGNTKEYDSPISAMQDALNYILEIEKQIDYTINVCIEYGHKMWEDFFRDFQIKNIAPYTHQINKFVEALKDYDEDNIMASFNKDYKAYIVLENND